MPADRPLSPGERAVWAARYALAHAAGVRVEVAAQVAARAVTSLRTLEEVLTEVAGRTTVEADGLVPLSSEARRMLAEMVGEGEPR